MTLNQNEPRIAIVVHGGAAEVEPEYHEAARAGCIAAAEAGWHVLAAGGSALDAVEAAVRALEDDPTFNAARGAALTAAGSVELDAGLMDGESLKIGAVAAVSGYPHPVSIARRVMERTRHHLLVGPGAEAFAAQEGFAMIENRELVVERRRAAYEQERAAEGGSRGRSTREHDTVGAVALDARGCVAAATSTGGLTMALPGRVGDSPLPGAGFYADNRSGGVACTGDGEQIMRIGLALRTIQYLESGMSAPAVAPAALDLLDRVGGEAGLIVLDVHGRVGIAHNALHMPHAYRTAGMQAIASAIALTP